MKAMSWQQSPGSWFSQSMITVDLFGSVIFLRQIFYLYREAKTEKEHGHTGRAPKSHFPKHWTLREARLS